VHSKIGNHKRVAFDITHTHTYKSLKNPQQSSSSHVGYWLKGASGFWEVFPGVIFLLIFPLFLIPRALEHTQRERDKNAEETIPSFNFQVVLYFTFHFLSLVAI
jgi:hypothetical protein